MLSIFSVRAPYFEHVLIAQLTAIIHISSRPLSMCSSPQITPLIYELQIFCDLHFSFRNIPTFSGTEFQFADLKSLRCRQTSDAVRDAPDPQHQYGKVLYNAIFLRFSVGART